MTEKAPCPVCGTAWETGDKWLLVGSSGVCEKCRGKSPRCSFCNRDSKTVKHLIAGPKGYICDQCLGTCTEMLTDEE